MIERIQQLLSLLDLPSGVVVGLFTLVMIVLCIVAFCVHRSIDSSIVACYGAVVTLFAVHKTTTSIATITTSQPPK